MLKGRKTSLLLSSIKIEHDHKGWDSVPEMLVFSWDPFVSLCALLCVAWLHPQVF